jgi:hypothetical protein
VPARAAGLRAAARAGRRRGQPAGALPAAYSRIVVFGDGLTDGGFFGRLTANRYPPSPPFFEGRWTNGPTWIEVLAAQSGWRLDAKDNHAQGPGLSHGLQSQRSCSADVQALAPRARVIKAFTIYGFENLDDNRFPAANVKPATMYCGDDAAAKGTVAQLIGQLGWEPLDVGGLVQALHREHMTLRWIRRVRMGGQSPHLVWAALRR